MGKGDSRRPQQPELARDGRNQTDARHWTERAEARERPENRGSGGPVPPENRPGHRPPREQDRPQGPPEEEPEAPEDPTVEADQTEPDEPGPGDSEGARPE